MSNLSGGRYKQKNLLLKNLLLIAAIPISNAVHAETWHCNSTHGSVVNDYGLQLLSQEYVHGKWVADTNQGLLHGEEESTDLFGSKFSGTCNRHEEKFVRCDVSSLNEDAITLSILIIDTVWSKYSYSSIKIQHTASVNSEIGTCTKI
jgi:hypothetical protein